jgi:hypothetical protein
LDEAEDGHQSDKSDLIGERPRRRRNRHYDDDEDDDEYDDEVQEVRGA